MKSKRVVSRSGCVSIVLALVVIATAAPGPGSRAVAPAAQPAPVSRPPGRAAAMLGRLPMYFEANAGQADGAVRFVSQGQGYNLLLTPREIVLGLLPAAAGARRTAIRLQLVGAAAEPQMVGLDWLPGVVNYLLGLDRTRWHTGIPTYARVRYRDVYPGIDVIFYGKGQQLEHDFVVAPGRDPGAIAVNAAGADSLALDPSGDLLLAAGGGELRLRKPAIYQEIDGSRREVAGGYVLTGERGYGFRVGAYDRTRPLVIDPVLSFSTYLGGNGSDYGAGVATDAAGNIYVTGATLSTNFPVQNPVGGFNDSGVNCPKDATPYRVCFDAFVTKLDPSGTTLLYSTYIGSRGDDEGRAIAVDANGNAYMAGYLSLNGDPPLQDYYIYPYALVVKLTPEGGLGYSSWWGPNDTEAHGIAVDDAGRAYVTGQTTTGAFPTSANAIQTERLELIDGWVSVLDPSGQNLVYSTYLGGSGAYCGECYSSGNAIAVDGSGKIYVTGQAAPSFPTTANAFQRKFDGFWMAFLTVIDPSQAGDAGLAYSTYLGGFLSDFGNGIALGPPGVATITGSTNSDDFPTTPGAFDRTCGTDGICNTTTNQVCENIPGLPYPVCHVDAKADAFVARFDTTRSGAASLLYSTYVGGAGKDEGYDVKLDAASNAYVTGKTVSPNFPTVAATQPAIGGASDAFLFRLDPTGSGLNFSTFLGGSGDDLGAGVALDGEGNAVLVGSTASPNFPVQNAFRSAGEGVEAFVAKFGMGGTGANHTLFLPSIRR